MFPSYFGKYFWDIDIKNIDLRNNSSYIAERLLELGDFEEVAWLLRTYKKEFIKNVIQKSRNLSLKSANFYSIYFGIDPKSILCLQEDYHRLHKKIWRY